MSSTAKVRICWRTPSSSNSKSSLVSALTGAPVLSRTTRSTRTRSTPLRKGEAGCWPERDATSRTRKRTMKKRVRHLLKRSRQKVSETFFLESKPDIDRHGSHRPDRQHLAEGRRVDVGVDRCPLHFVEQVVRVDLKRKRPVGRETDIARQYAIQLTRTRTDDDVAVRVAEEPGRRNRERRGIEELVDGRIAQLDRGAVVIGSQGSVRSTRDVEGFSDHPGGEGGPRLQCHGQLRGPASGNFCEPAAVLQPVPIGPERQLDGDVAGELLPAVEARKRPLGVEILVGLCDDPRPGAKRRSVVHGFCNRVGHARTNPAGPAPPHQNRPGVQYRVTARRLPDEWLNVRNQRP